VPDIECAEELILALVIEDNERTLAETGNLLTTQGMTVVPARSAADAVKEIKGAPGFDVILSDINLDPLRYHDKSGIRVAEIVRATNAEIPIFGYSSFFSEDQLTPEEWSVFTRHFPKAPPKVKAVSILTQVEEMKTAALSYRKLRAERAAKRLEEFRQKYPMAHSDFATLRFLVPARLYASGGDPKSVEDLLRGAGYRIRVIERGCERPLLNDETAAVVSPIIFWLRDADGCSIAEVYGYPELYSYGADGEEAVRNVLLLMDGFYQDLADESDADQASTLTQRLRDFLVAVFG
jgi:CheY-like chemotaxis protein